MIPASDRRPALAAALGLVLLALPLVLCAGEKHGHHKVPHQPRDPEAYMGMLEREGRDDLLTGCTVVMCGVS